MWKWGGGWLAEIGFHDFAGSTIVHAVGGWAALMGALVLGPRLGKYVNGKVVSINGHNLPLATIGTFLLWLGWFGFNGGSVLSADPGAVSHVLVTTNLAAAAGVMGAFLVTHVSDIEHYDLGMVLNGSLAGLVSITAGADVVSPNAALIIGLIGGGLVVASIRLLDKWGIDDPVSAISVHLSCGIWGTLAVGLFGVADPAVLGYALSFKAQLIGVLAAGAFCAITSFALFYGIHKIIDMRVSPEHEAGGLDLYEHGVEAYTSLPAAPPN
jgi:Amt family ammonium transporter